MLEISSTQPMQLAGPFLIYYLRAQLNNFRSLRLPDLGASAIARVFLMDLKRGSNLF
jgi:hypothetical protein